MGKRSATVVAAAGLIAVGLLAGRLALLVVAIVIAAVAAGEMFRLLRANGVLPSAIVGHAGTVALLIVAYVRGVRAPAVFPFVIAGALGASFATMLARRTRANVTRAVAFTMIPVLTVGLLGAYVIALRSSAGGFRLAWVFVLMAAAAELGAAGVTEAIRRRSLTPRTRRTWERLAGALLGAFVAALVAATAASPPFTWGRALLLGGLVALAVATADEVWDMVESDLARAEPGVRRPRVVVLQRVDGALLAAPIFFYVFRALVR
jgi:CDP-diglyceride synthetase